MALSFFAAKHVTLASLTDGTSLFDDFEQTDSLWFYSDKIGAPSASSFERAKIALAGPLGLSAKEAVYLVATTDNQNRTLSSSCDYRVTGTPFDTRWWSITLYDSQTQHYVPNAIKRSSWNSEALTQDQANHWTITVSSTPKDQFWLPSQANDGAYNGKEDGRAFELLLRLYNPSEETRKLFPNITLPDVERLSC